MKIQRAIPCSLKVIDLADAGEVIRVINPIHPTIAILLVFNYYLYLFSSLTPVSLFSFDVAIKKTRKEAVLSSPRVSLASKKDS